MTTDKTLSPIISIITVTYNDAKRLEKTIKSISKQSYKNIEYIIIDGGSSDGTLAIIQQYEKSITKWISEKDEGIYDAMNKGIQLAQGNWINFMNAGDIFHNLNVLSNIFATTHYDTATKIIYGNHVADYQNGYKRVVKVSPQPKLLNGMPFCHQSTFVRLQPAQKILFDTNYQLAADYQFILQIFKKGSQFKYIPFPISIIETVGIAEKNILTTLKEQQKIATFFSTTYLQKTTTYLYFSIKLSYAKGIKWVKNNTSVRLIQKLTKLKYQLIGH